MLNDDFAQVVQTARAAAAPIEGWLTPREEEFLALLAAQPTTEGEVLEIGSFHGRSTILLCTAIAAAGLQGVNSRLSACDPLPGEHIHDLRRNLQSAQVTDRVEFHHMFSSDLAPNFDRPLRLLWIDGDHCYRWTKHDFDAFVPRLADRAILAMHDVLNPSYEGPVRVFCDDVLRGKHFGSAGICGSIGWAQYFADPSQATGHERQKGLLRQRLNRLAPFVRRDEPPRGLARLHYKLHRWRVPHQAIVPEHWVRQVAEVIRN